MLTERISFENLIKNVLLFVVLLVCTVWINSDKADASSDFNINDYNNAPYVNVDKTTNCGTVTANGGVLKKKYRFRTNDRANYMYRIYSYVDVNFDLSNTKDYSFMSRVYMYDANGNKIEGAFELGRYLDDDFDNYEIFESTGPSEYFYLEPNTTYYLSVSGETNTGEGIVNMIVEKKESFPIQDHLSEAINIKNNLKNTYSIDESKSPKIYSFTTDKGGEYSINARILGVHKNNLPSVKLTFYNSKLRPEDTLPVFCEAYESSNEYVGAVKKMKLPLLKPNTTYYILAEDTNVGQFEMQIEGSVKGSNQNTESGTARKPGQNGISISDAYLKKVKYSFTGKKLRPEIYMKGRKLKRGSDYTVSSVSKCNVGKNTIKIKGVGKYYGSKTIKFKVVPKGTKIKSITVWKGKIKIVWRKQAIQTSGYQIQYSKSRRFKPCKTTTIKNTKRIKRTIRKTKGKKYYRIRTFKTIKGKYYYSNWSKEKRMIVK